MEFEPGAIQLQAEDGTMVTLDKLIKVRHVEERPQSYYRINGLNSVYLYITAEETANQLNLSGEVKHLMGELQQKMPPGYEVHISYDATEYIQKELDKIYFRTGLTVLILLLFVALITRNLRYLFLIVTSRRLIYLLPSFFIMHLVRNAALFIGGYYHLIEFGDR